MDSKSLDGIEMQVEEDSAVVNGREEETTHGSTSVEDNAVESNVRDVEKAEYSLGTPDRVKPIPSPRLRLTTQGTGRSGPVSGPVPTPTPHR